MTSQVEDISITTPRAIQFENANEGRSYPFSDNCVLKSTDGRMLPDNVITDMKIVVPDGSTASLSSVYITSNMLSVCVKVVNSSSTMALSATVAASDFESYVPYRMEKLVGSHDVGGIITFGDIDLGSCTGTYRFEDGAVTFSDNAITGFVPAGVRKFIDDRTGEELSGDVKMVFSSYVKASRDADGIHLDLESGANDLLMSKCDREKPVNPCGATPVRSINGIKPDDNNRIVIWFH